MRTSSSIISTCKHLHLIGTLQTLYVHWYVEDPLEKNLALAYDKNMIVVNS